MGKLHNPPSYCFKLPGNTGRAFYAGDNLIFKSVIITTMGAQCIFSVFKDKILLFCSTQHIPILFVDLAMWLHRFLGLWRAHCDFSPMLSWRDAVWAPAEIFLWILCRSFFMHLFISTDATVFSTPMAVSTALWLNPQNYSYPVLAEDTVTWGRKWKFIP